MENIAKRVFICLSCIPLLVAFIVMPAVAADVGYSQPMENYFDYNDAPTSYVIRPESNVITFPLQKKMYVRYIDLVIATPTPFTSVSVTSGNKTTQLSMLNVSGDTYRIYGELSGGYNAWDDQLTFTFSITGTTQIHVLSFNYSLTWMEYVSDVGTVSAFNTVDLNTVYTKTMAGVNSPALINFYSQPVAGTYMADFYCSNWRKYDYLDFYINLDVPSVSSIAVHVNNSFAVPFVVSYLDGGGNLSYEIVQDPVASDYYTGDAYYTFPNGITSQWLHVHLDLTEVSKTISGDPVISLSGPMGAYETDYSISLIAVAGSSEIDNQSPLSVWFNNIKEFFRDLFNPDDGDSSDVGDELDQTGQELDNIGSEFDQIDTPDIDTGDLTGNFTQFSPSGLSVLGVITNNGYVTSLLVLVFTFALVAYIFFGKR